MSCLTVGGRMRGCQPCPGDELPGLRGPRKTRLACLSLPCCLPLTSLSRRLAHLNAFRHRPSPQQAASPSPPAAGRSGDTPGQPPLLIIVL